MTNAAETTARADVVICGAGIAGVAAAYYLATERQITDICIVDKLPPLSLTSAKSGENFRDWWPHPAMVALTRRSIELMGALAATTDNSFNMERRGYAYVSADPAFAAQIDDYLRPYRQNGLNRVRLHRDNSASYQPGPAGSKPPDHDADLLLNRALIADAFPHLAPAVQVVVHTRNAGSVSAHQLGMLLLTRAKALGVREVRGEVTGVVRDGQGVSAVTVQAPAGPLRIDTRRFIDAAGPFLAPVAALLEATLPVSTVFQQKIAFRDTLGVVPRSAPFTIFMDPQRIEWDDEERNQLQADPALHWLLEEFPGGLHVKPEGSGDSDWVKLGWAYNQTAESPRWQRPGAPEFPELVVRGAGRMIPGLRRYAGRLSNSLVHYGGYYTKTADNLPLIGPLCAHGEPIPGAYVLGALSGFGTMTACAAGELMAAWVAGDEAPDYARIFSPAGAEKRRISPRAAETETGEL